MSDGQLAATLEPLTVVAEGLVSGFVTPVIDVSIFRAAALAKERRRRAGSTAEVVVTTEGHGTTKHEPVAVGAMGAGQRQASGGSVAEMALDLSGRAALVRSGGAEAPAVNVLVDAVPGEAIDVETLVGLLYDSLDDGLRTVVLCPAEFS